MKTLAINIGNTSLFCGVFSGEKLLRQFRVPVRGAATAGGFARFVASRVPVRIDRAVLCSVVPVLTLKIAALTQKHFGVAACILTVDAAHGLKLGYRRPRQLGTDRLAAALGARKRFPRRNVIVVDCGTATTLTGLRRDGVLLGGAIFPGVTLWSVLLAARTAQLPKVALRRPRVAVGRSTEENLRSGIYHGHAGAIRELARRIGSEAFGRAPAVVVGTGGHAADFAADVFDVVVSELVLEGLNIFAASVTQHGALTRRKT